MRKVELKLYNTEFEDYYIQGAILWGKEYILDTGTAES